MLQKFFLIFVSTLIACSSARKSTPPPGVVSGPNSLLIYNAAATNSPEAIKKPYVVLVSIDGYRHDYNRIFSPPNLTKMASEGLQAESLKPVYPSKTFPSHYSIVTGLTADRHGIVSNEFYDPARDASYSLPDRKAVEDGSWYSGEPLWITAQKQGVLTASYFWVGSEAPIQGMHPNYFYRYDGQVPYEVRVDQVLAWLNMPEEKRPHFITLYFDAVDSAAHGKGVNSKETREAVAHVDQMLGRLRTGIQATGLPVNLIVLSDHGMADLDSKKVVLLDATAEASRILAKFKMVGRGPQALLYLNKGEDPKTILEAQRILSKTAGKKYRVWRRDQLARLNYAANPRVGDLVIDPELPYAVGTRARPPSTTGANHGWDPAAKAMQGIFIATGPNFKQQTKVPTFDSVHVYPLILEILGLQQNQAIDGQLSAVKNLLR